MSWHDFYKKNQQTFGAFPSDDKTLCIMRCSSNVLRVTYILYDLIWSVKFVL